jgi:hypothetical protein
VTREETRRRLIAMVCPYCGAEPGHKCRTVSGIECPYPHVQRGTVSWLDVARIRLLQAMRHRMRRRAVVLEEMFGHLLKETWS